MKNILLKLTGTVIFLLIIAGCTRAGNRESGAEAPASEVKGALRIISAAPSNTDIVVGLGLGDDLIAVDRYSAGIPGVPQGLPEIDFFYPDTEAVIGMEPDIILVNEINSYGVSENPFKMLEGLGIKVVPVNTSTSVEGIYNDIVFIAGELGVKEKGEALAQTMKKEIELIAAAEGSGARSVYFEVSPAPSIVSLGNGTYINDMIELAGGRNIFADQNGWFSPGAEEIIGRNPDIIFAMAYSGTDPVPEIKNRAAFQTIKAIRENRVYSIDADSASRPSQNILKAFRQMAGALNN